jgi:hypothetical protein
LSRSTQESGLSRKKEEKEEEQIVEVTKNGEKLKAMKKRQRY